MLLGEPALNRTITKPGAERHHRKSQEQEIVVPIHEGRDKAHDRKLRAGIEKTVKHQG